MIVGLIYLLLMACDTVRNSSQAPTNVGTAASNPSTCCSTDVNCQQQQQHNKTIVYCTNNSGQIGDFNTKVDLLKLTVGHTVVTFYCPGSEFTVVMECKTVTCQGLHSNACIPLEGFPGNTWQSL